MRGRMTKVASMKVHQKEGWDLLLKNYEMRQRHDMSRIGNQRHISMGLGHRLARMMKGHI